MHSRPELRRNKEMERLRVSVDEWFQILRCSQAMSWISSPQNEKRRPMGGVLACAENQIT
jgi:hypothetical protein